MKKNDIFTFLNDVEKNDETLKKWGDLYRFEREIIETIVNTRKSKGLSQKQLAEMTGLKQPAIARIENNTNSPQLDTIIKIADALGLKITLKDPKLDNYDNLFEDIFDFNDAIASYYTRVLNTKHQFFNYNYQGGLYHEDSSHQHPCEKNHTT
jgi:transcriptional regulator with XRE-family HTH domain